MRLFAFALASLLATTANAVPIIYSFTGELTAVNASFRNHETGEYTHQSGATTPLVVNGVTLLDGTTAMTGTITLDSEILNGSGPLFGGQVLGWQLVFGGTTFYSELSGHGSLQVMRYSPGRAHMWDELSGGQYMNADVGYLTFNFDPSTFADSLPGPLPIESFLDGTFLLSGLQGSGANGAFSGAITSLTRVTDVPEPATAALLSAGLLGLAMSRRRRH